MMMMSMQHQFRNQQHKRRNQPPRRWVPLASLFLVCVCLCFLCLQINSTISQASAPVKDEDEEVLALKDRLAAYNLDSSPEHTGNAPMYPVCVNVKYHSLTDVLTDGLTTSVAMETESTEGQQKGKKAPSKRGAAKKAMASFADESDEEIAVHDSEDEEFAVAEAPIVKKTGGRKPAAEKPKTTVRKRAPAPSKGMRQKVLEETFKPTDDSNSSAPSPEKKVRKIRASPFNKKSSSVLQRAASASTSAEDAEAPPSGSSAEPVAPRRTVRERKTTTVYTIDSESEDNDTEDEDVLDLSDDSEYSDD